MDNPSAPLIRRRRRWPVILSIVVLVPTTVLAFLWSGIPPRIPTQPIRLVRGEDGQMNPAGRPEPLGLASFEVQASQINANNSLTSSSVTSRGDHSGFACSRLAIFNQSSHLLMARIGPLLLEELKPQGYVHQIDYYPAGFGPDQGELSPDVRVTLDMSQLVESGWPTSHALEATFTVTASNGPPGCRNSYNDHLTPPRVQFDWNTTLHHRSTTTGVSSSAAKYKLVAENVAKQIAEALIKEFRDRREKDGVVPELPSAFYPAYREFPAFPPGEFSKLQLVTSSHGLMNHNETLWRLPIDRSATDMLTEMRRQLEASGWKTQDHSTAPGQDYWRMSRNDAIILAYVVSPRETPDFSSEAPVLYVQYTDRMTQDEVRAAIDELLAKGTSTDVLISFERHWSTDQSRRILELIRSRKAQTPQVSLALANLYHRLKQDDNARAELLRTCALLRTVAQSSDLEGKVRSLAKDLGDEKLAEKPITLPVMEELGFVELRPGIQITPREIGLEEPVHFYVQTSSGSLRTISFRMIKNACACSEPCQLAYVDSSEHGRSWGTGGSVHDVSLENGCRVTFALERSGTAERARLISKLSGP